MSRYAEQRAALDIEIQATIQRLVSLSAQRNALAPITALPDEILLEIFHRLPDHPLYTVLPVCKRWAKLCCTTFSLWRVTRVQLGWNSALVVTPGERERMHGELARVADYQYGRIHTLNVSWFGEGVLIYEQRDLLSDIAPTLVVLSVDESLSSSLEEFIAFMMPPIVAAARLRSLCLCAIPDTYKRLRETDDEEIFETHRAALQLSELPVSVKALSLGCVRLIPAERGPQNAPLPALTHLTLKECHPVALPLLFHVLRNSPQLRTLTLERNFNTSDERTGSTPESAQTEPIALNQLQTLTLVEHRDPFNAILLRTTFPDSTKVTLRIVENRVGLRDVLPVIELTRRLRFPATANTLVLDRHPSYDHLGYTIHLSYTRPGHEFVNLHNDPEQNNNAETTISFFSFTFIPQASEETPIMQSLLQALTHSATIVQLVLVQAHALSGSIWDGLRVWHVPAALSRIVLALPRGNTEAATGLLAMLTRAVNEALAAGSMPLPLHTIELDLHPNPVVPMRPGHWQPPDSDDPAENCDWTQLDADLFPALHSLLVALQRQRRSGAPGPRMEVIVKIREIERDKWDVVGGKLVEGLVDRLELRLVPEAVPVSKKRART
ncbi:hypothetical protein HMN09_00841500 [Mycena chlorophos]|uniref:F-box domain-containing protein n=1 Tax=Mycena chlorophos TaxID=658473 RepID=A0A8H6W3L2_MYCCL|nr:hypothetical protein HMN09_00841500 [Mycena chlorophos]